MANPVINSLEVNNNPAINPAAVNPLGVVTIEGSGFGANQGSGFVLFANNGTNWGGPGNQPLWFIFWADTEIVFQVPQGVSPCTPAVITVTDSAGNTSNPADMSIWGIPIIQSVLVESGPPGLNTNPLQTAEPDNTITINGQCFGPQQGDIRGYVLFVDGPINWGGPGDIAKWTLKSWGPNSIQFKVPQADSTTTPGFTYKAAPGTASFTVTNGGGHTSNAAEIMITGPVISSVVPSTAAPSPLPSATAQPGGSIKIIGSGFEAQQGTGFVLLGDCGVNWGGPGDIAKWNLVAWSDTLIEFSVPVPDSTTTPGFTYQAAPGTATINVTTDGGLTSNTASLTIPFVINVSEFSHGAITGPFNGLTFALAGSSPDSSLPIQSQIGPGAYLVVVPNCGTALTLSPLWESNGYGICDSQGNSHISQLINDSPATILVSPPNPV
jgi:hypothetical protein